MSLTSEPNKLTNMALDTLARVLEIDCCWIQTISDRKHKKLLLTAERGFSPEMRQEIYSMDMGHNFSKQIIGLGHKVVIPDLANDGWYGLPSFKTTGYRWLVAVPLMTYRVHGILGTASRNRKRLKKDTADLIMVIAGLIGASLNNAHLSHQPPLIRKSSSAPSSDVAKGSDTTESKPEVRDNSGVSDNATRQESTRHPDGAFYAHARKMELFRRSHH